MTIDRLVGVIRVGAVVLAAFATIGVLGPFELPLGIDKAAHVGLFYGFMVLCFAALPWHRKQDLATAGVAIAAASEIAQAFTGRSMSLADFAANCLGVALATCPIYVARFRHLAQRNRYATLSELRQQNRRRSRNLRAGLKAARTQKQATVSGRLPEH